MKEYKSRGEASLEWRMLGKKQHLGELRRFGPQDGTRRQWGRESQNP